MNMPSHCKADDAQDTGAETGAEIPGEGLGLSDM